MARIGGRRGLVFAGAQQAGKRRGRGTGYSRGEELSAMHGGHLEGAEEAINRALA